MKTELTKLIVEIATRNTHLNEKMFFMNEYDNWIGKKVRIFAFNPPNWMKTFLGREKDDWLFSRASDEETKKLLLSFLSREYDYNNPPNDDECDLDWNLNCEFTRLLYEKGYLIKSKVENIINNIINNNKWSSWLVCSGVHWLDNCEDKAIDLLNLSYNDSRDGIFLGIWGIDSKKVNEALLSKFNEWTSEKNWGSGTGEGWWLQQFLNKWIANGVFDINRLEKLIKWNCKQEYGFL